VCKDIFSEVQSVNNLIAQIKKLEDEEKIIGLFESGNSNNQLA
jgi:hypothetical protein